MQSQAEARQVWSREAKSLWSQQESICPAARQLLAGDTYLAVRAGHFSQAELFCFVKDTVNSSRNLVLKVTSIFEPLMEVCSSHTRLTSGGNFLKKS